MNRNVDKPENKEIEEKNKALNTDEKIQSQRRRSHQKCFLNILKKLTEESKPVTIIINSGESCCELEGCVLAVNDEFLTLLSNVNACGRIYIRISCICAIINPN